MSLRLYPFYNLAMPNLSDKREILYSERRTNAASLRNRRPFWLPASNYYVLSVAISAGFFFLVWGILHDGGEEMPWVTAGISASVMLCGAVILREIVLRRARNRFLSQQRLLDDNVHEAYSRFGDNRSQNKLTLEKNAAILNEIRQKSEAAKVLSKLSAGHREVFELCSEYLARNDVELKTVSASSPRFGALLKGRAAALDWHRFHTLKWAEIEARSLTNDATGLVNTTKKIEAAQNALGVLESALALYPSESSLLESRELLSEMVVSIKVSHWVERAERAAFKGNYSRAKSLYRDALFYLGRDNVHSEDRNRVASCINAEIEKIRALESDER